MDAVCRYIINEFSVVSDFPLAGVAHDTAFGAPNLPQVTIRRGHLGNIPSLLRKLRRQLVYDVGDGFLIEPPSGVCLHINFRGDTITVDAPDDKLPIASAWAVHAGLGAATLTHGGLPLHGAALETDDKLFCLMAHSGAGKSTLSWFLLQNDSRFANDDLVAVRIGEGAVTAFPSCSLFPKLSRDAVDRHGLKLAELLPADYGTGEEEYYTPLPRAERVLDPRPLSAIFILQPTREESTGCGSADCACGGECTCGTGAADSCVPDLMQNEVVPRRLSPEEAALALHSQLHAVWLLGKWMDTKKLAALCREIANFVPVYSLHYRRSFQILPDLEQVIRTLLLASPDLTDLPR